MIFKYSVSGKCSEKKADFRELTRVWIENGGYGRDRIFEKMKGRKEKEIGFILRAKLNVPGRTLTFTVDYFNFYSYNKILL